MNKPTYTTVTPTDEPDDSLAAARGIAHSILIMLGAVLLVVLWLAGPVWVFGAGVVGLAIWASALWGRGAR